MNATPSTPQPHTPESSTWRSPFALKVLISTVVLGLIADLGSKYWAFHSIADFPVEVRREEVMVTQNLGTLIPYHDPVAVIPKLLDFTLVLNPGAVFGIGAGKRWFFVVFTAIAITVCTVLFGKWTKPREWPMHMALGLVISGGIGNLYDRLLYACVRDFIHPLPGMTFPFGLKMPWGQTEVWPYVSNVADLFLIIGIVMLAWKSVRQPHSAPKAST